MKGALDTLLKRLAKLKGPPALQAASKGTRPPAIAPDSGPLDGIVQLHAAGNVIRLVLRFPGEAGMAVGWALDIQRGAEPTADIASADGLRALAADFDVRGTGVFKSLCDGGIFAVPLEPHDAAMLADDAAGENGEIVAAIERVKVVPMASEREWVSYRVDGQKFNGVFRCESWDGQPWLAGLWPDQSSSVWKSVRLLKASATESEERFVLGVVLEPETVDLQGDVYSAGEVRKAAHAWMAYFQEAGIQHERSAGGRVQILESYLAPVDFEIGGQQVKAGTWLLGVRVVDDILWSRVKAGEFTGFSIGGYAVSTPEEQTSDAGAQTDASATEAA